jgi:hypothetical protein
MAWTSIAAVSESVTMVGRSCTDSGGWLLLGVSSSGMDGHAAPIMARGSGAESFSPAAW